MNTVSSSMNLSLQVNGTYLQSELTVVSKDGKNVKMWNCPVCRKLIRQDTKGKHIRSDFHREMASYRKVESVPDYHGRFHFISQVEPTHVQKPIGSTHLFPSSNHFQNQMPGSSQKTEQKEFPCAFQQNFDLLQVNKENSDSLNSKTEKIEQQKDDWVWVPIPMSLLQRITAKSSFEAEENTTKTFEQTIQKDKDGSNKQEQPITGREIEAISSFLSLLRIINPALAAGTKTIPLQSLMSYLTSISFSTATSAHASTEANPSSPEFASLPIINPSPASPTDIPVSLPPTSFDEVSRFWQTDAKKDPLIDPLSTVKFSIPPVLEPSLKVASKDQNEDDELLKKRKSGRRHVNALDDSDVTLSKRMKTQSRNQLTSEMQPNIQPVKCAESNFPSFPPTQLQAEQNFINAQNACAVGGEQWDLLCCDEDSDFFASEASSPDDSPLMELVDEEMAANLEEQYLFSFLG
ncbi:uncharacterized protein MONOS_598 [Monocercomonoides exilis]|uniref:uncharacterized protein n=1 Tax=Monocercomonoides exilis TaxID=2049356 RepID=UPI00355A1014|nr:hypothetical protein MONOS_598 [Monocercomonoides exilis]|eukprot:MONOS_598.1-p1 / transcript=MONOS_598.1 / gene=MONOS_598 / organism=Monocercomonoides_exilis_PA203 / gene_product=unspecified product / transcript_product=unspecified product / location=Mono_scaffold00009:222849-224311(+) / protein_length=464 / sequence_SO=supercontig / SO=protein_coding / is_pseudo=false